MTLNGHDCDYGPAANVRVGNREQIFFNRQDLDKGRGAATARIYTFNMKNPEHPNVIISTYQTYGVPHYIMDPTNRFNFSSTLIPYSPSTVKIATGTGTIYMADAVLSVSLPLFGVLFAYLVILPNPSGTTENGSLNE